MKLLSSPAVVNLINTTFDSNISTEMEASYGFNYVDLSPNDEKRFSGMANNLKFSWWPDSYERSQQGTFLRPGKLLKAYFPDKGQDELSTMGAKLAKKLCGLNDEKLARIKVSNRPSEVYGLRHADRGSVGSSCMRDQDEDFFQLYDDCANISIAYIVEDDELIARALLYEKVLNEDTGKYIRFMDRIYTNNDNLEGLFTSFAIANNYYRKKYQSADYFQQVISPSGNHLHLKLSFELPFEELDRVPYLDTFITFCNCGHNPVLRNGWGCACDTLQELGGSSCDGVFTRRVMAHCCSCECNIYENDDDYTYSQGYYYCSSCAEELVQCDHCEELFNEYDLENMVVDGETLTLCDSCSSDVNFCNVCGEGFWDSLEVVHSSDGSVQDACPGCIDDMEEAKEIVTCSCGNYHSGTNKCYQCLKLEKDRLKLNISYNLILTAMKDKLDPSFIQNGVGFRLLNGELIEWKKEQDRIGWVPVDPESKLTASWYSMNEVDTTLRRIVLWVGASRVEKSQTKLMSTKGANNEQSNQYLQAA